MVAKDFCSISDNQCVAPAGYGVPGRGWAHGSKKVSTKCRHCDNFVCKKCSKVVRVKSYRLDKKGKKRRVCSSCYEELKKHEARAAERKEEAKAARRWSSHAARRSV